MAFCSSCGEKLTDGTKFCPHCGTKIQLEDYKHKRTEEYAGKIIKCPACGSELPSFTAVCPGCGHEINSSKISDSLSSFIRQIDDCDKRIATSTELHKNGWSTWSLVEKFGWIMLNLLFAFIPLMIYLLKPLFRTDNAPRLTIEEKHKATIIENYPFPNDRGSIIEALIFMKSKVSFLATKEINASNIYWARLWTKKAEQLYQNAQILFPGDQIVSSTYCDIVSNFAKVRRKRKIRLLLTVVIILMFCSYAYLSEY